MQIVNSLDFTELDTIGWFVDTCRDTDYLLNKLLPVLIPMQQGEIDYKKGNIEFEHSHSNTTKLGYIEWVKDKFDYQL